MPKKKTVVSMHSDGYSKAVPAVDVKCFSFARGLRAEHFGCDEATFEKAMEFAFDTHAEQFWNEINDVAKEILDDPSVVVYSAGRSSGWAEVHNLPDPEDWDEDLLNRWDRFEEWCMKEILYLASDEAVKESILANEWHKPGSQQYNMVTLASGENISLPDLEARNQRYIKAAPKLIEALEEAERVIRWAAQESAGRVRAEVVAGWSCHADKIRATLKEVSE